MCTRLVKLHKGISQTLPVALYVPEVKGLTKRSLHKSTHSSTFKHVIRENSL